MVSKASEDLPEPERPVMTVSLLRGISTLMFFRLCWRAPRTVILLMLITKKIPPAHRERFAVRRKLLFYLKGHSFASVGGHEAPAAENFSVSQTKTGS